MKRETCKIRAEYTGTFAGIKLYEVQLVSYITITVEAEDEKSAIEAAAHSEELAEADWQVNDIYPVSAQS